MKARMLSASLERPRSRSQGAAASRCASPGAGEKRAQFVRKSRTILQQRREGFLGDGEGHHIGQSPDRARLAFAQQHPLLADQVAGSQTMDLRAGGIRAAGETQMPLRTIISTDSTSPSRATTSSLR